MTSAKTPVWIGNEWVLLFTFSYELVRYTDNHDEYLKAMGSPAALMWMARLLVERFTIRDVGDDGLLTFHWKFRKLEPTVPNFCV